MKLALLYDHLLTRAVKTGEDQHADLKGGARLAVRARDGVITVSFCRPHKRLGDIEEVTFRAVCQVPASAVRIPAEGQKERLASAVVWYIVAYRWTEPTLQPPAALRDGGAIMTDRI